MFESFIYDNNFEKTNSDSCVFVKRYSSGDLIILLIYVDDMLVVESDLKKKLKH
jgi:choline kinase